MSQKALGLAPPVALKRGALRQGVGVPAWDVGLVQLTGGIQQRLGHGELLGQLLQEARHRVAPGHGSQPLEDGLHRLFRRMLRREGRPLKKPFPQGKPGLLQVPLGLKQEVPAPLHLQSLSLIHI